MSRTRPLPVETAQLEVGCSYPYCAAPPWAWCVGKGGAWAKQLHAWRFRLATVRGFLPLPDDEVPDPEVLG